MNETQKRLIEDVKGRWDDFLVDEINAHGGIPEHAARTGESRNALATAIEALLTETNKSEMQPTPKRNDGPCVQDLFAHDLLQEAEEKPLLRKALHQAAADIMQRKEIGIERYGTVLQPFNGRSSLLDAYEELLDGGVYIRQKIAEYQLAPENMHKTYPSELHRIYRNTLEAIGRLRTFMEEA